MACKAITTEVEDHELKVGLSPEDQTTLYDIKKRFSTELSNLLASAKYYAGGMGISPVSLVDAAAGNLTVTIVDLVKLLGMRPVNDNQHHHHSQPSKPPNKSHFAPVANPNMSMSPKMNSHHIIHSGSSNNMMNSSRMSPKMLNKMAPNSPQQMNHNMIPTNNMSPNGMSPNNMNTSMNYNLNSSNNNMTPSQLSVRKYIYIYRYRYIYTYFFFI